MLFVVPVYHTLEQGTGLIPQCTGVQVDQQEERKHESNNHMKRIIKYEPAYFKYGSGDPLRKHQPDPGDNKQGHAQVHGQDIGYFLQGVELLFLGNGKWMRFILEDPDCIKMKLFP